MVISTPPLYTRKPTRNGAHHNTVTDWWLTCGWPVTDLWVVCDWPVSDLGVICDWPGPVTDLWLASEWPVTDLGMTSNWPVTDLWLTCEWSVTGRWVTWEWSATDLDLWLTCEWPVADQGRTGQWPATDQWLTSYIYQGTPNLMLSHSHNLSEWLIALVLIIKIAVFIGHYSVKDDVSLTAKRTLFHPVLLSPPSYLWDTLCSLFGL